MEHTFCIIKPDSFKNKNVGNILSRLEQEGFEITSAKKMDLDIAFCKVFYAEHINKPFFSSLVEFMTSGPVLALALKREEACSYLRKVMGATNPVEAEKSSIRSLYAESIERNAIHGSDSLKSAQRELSLFFPEVLF